MPPLLVLGVHRITIPRPHCRTLKQKAIRVLSLCLSLKLAMGHHQAYPIEVVARPTARRRKGSHERRNWPKKLFEIQQIHHSHASRGQKTRRQAFEIGAVELFSKIYFGREHPVTAVFGIDSLIGLFRTTNESRCGCIERNIAIELHAFGAPFQGREFLEEFTEFADSQSGCGGIAVWQSIFAANPATGGRSRAGSCKARTREGQGIG